jgi:hypothetical protein
MNIIFDFIFDLFKLIFSDKIPIFLSVIKDLSMIVFGATGTIVAIVGLTTWKKELKIKTEYNIARKILLSSYKVRDALRNVRNPFLMLDKNDPGSKRNVYSKRFMEVDKASSELNVDILESEIHWGKTNIDEIFKPLFECCAKLFINVKNYLDNEDSKRYPKGSDGKEYNEIEKIIFEISENPRIDEFSGEIQKSIEKNENYLKPFLKI